MGELVLFQSARRVMLDTPPSRLKEWARRVHIGSPLVASGEVVLLEPATTLVSPPSREPEQKLDFHMMLALLRTPYNEWDDDY